MDGVTSGELRDVLLACLSIPRWADEVAAGAPYGSADELVIASDAAATPLSDAEIAEALSGHPRIGEQAEGTGLAQRLSRQEQRSSDADDDELTAAMAEGNRAYERRFGRIFLIRAAGRSRSEILAELHRRLRLGEDEEREVVAEELRAITALRLRRLFEASEIPGRVESARARL